VQLQTALCYRYTYEIIFITIFEIRQIINSLRVSNHPPPPKRIKITECKPAALLELSGGKNITNPDA
jgi:hypothetical protein